MLEKRGSLRKEGARGGLESLRGIVKAFRASSPAQKVAVCLILLSQLPLGYFACNHFFLDYGFDNGPYQHMHMCNRVYEGKPLYAPNATDHARVTYTPLYWWIVGNGFKLFGPSFVLARLVSLLCSVFFAVVLLAFAWRATGHNLLLTLAVPATVFVTNVIGGIGPWAFDINVNALHFVLVAAGFLLLRAPLSAPRVLAAALAFCLGTLAKQTGLAYVVAAAVLLLLKSRRLVLPYVLACLAMLGSSLVLIQRFGGEEFLRVTFAANLGPPWVLERLLKEVVLRNLMGIGGFTVLLTLFYLLDDRFGGFWERVLRPEFVMCASGFGVACISSPKIGSGGLHQVLSLAGFAICGYAALAKLANSEKSSLWRQTILWVPLLQLLFGLVVAIEDYPYNLADRHDRQKYESIANVFRSGRTCMYGFSYIQKVFGQPLRGYLPDEPSKWVNGRMDYSGVTEEMKKELTAPFTEKEFDFVIMTQAASRLCPVAQAVMENYQAVGVIPGHPRGPRGGNFRFQFYVMRPKPPPQAGTSK